MASFRAKLLASHAAVAAVVSAVSLLVIEDSTSQQIETQVDKRLVAQAEAVRSWVGRDGHPRDPDRLARRLSGVVGARVTLYDDSGAILGDSIGSREAQKETAAQEVALARAGKVGKRTRYSALEKQDIRYVAVPAPKNYVVRLGYRIGDLDKAKSDVRRQLVIAAVASLVVALLLATLVAGPLTRRLRAATAKAVRIARGDYAAEPGEASRDEVGRLAESLETVATELREAESRRKEFLATVAHEIRTPVTSIRGYTQTLLAADVPEADRREFLQTIHRNAERVGELVGQLLQLEALRAGTEKPTRDHVYLGPIIRHVASTMRAFAEDIDAELVVSADDSALVIGDADAIERILLNLVDNALKHGGEGVTVNVSARQEGRHVTVVIEDDGPGIAADVQEKVFQRFFRAVTNRRGSGLGLAIARELTTTMGGEIELASSSAGTRFTVTLPAA